MSKDNIGDYDATAGNNSDIAGIDIAENCDAANVNNAFRQGMAHLKSAIGAVADFIAGTSTYKWITPKNIADVITPTVVAYPGGGTLSLDMDTLTSLNLKMTVTGNLVVANIANKKLGKTIRLRITSDGTPGRTITWGSDFVSPGGLPQLTGTAGAKDCFYLTPESSTEVSVDYGRGYSA